MELCITFSLRSRIRSFFSKRTMFGPVFAVVHEFRESNSVRRRSVASSFVDVLRNLHICFPIRQKIHQDLCVGESLGLYFLQTFPWNAKPFLLFPCCGKIESLRSFQTFLWMASLTPVPFWTTIRVAMTFFDRFCLCGPFLFVKEGFLFQKGAQNACPGGVFV